MQADNSRPSTPRPDADRSGDRGPHHGHRRRQRRPRLAAFIEARRIDAAASRLAADIRFVRSEAMARQRPLRLSFHASASASCWVVHTGAAADCRCADDGPALCTGAAGEIKTVVLSSAERVSVVANVASIPFDPLHGSSTPTGTLRLVGTSRRASTTSSTSWAGSARARRAAR